jgi:hypothetical protein
MALKVNLQRTKERPASNFMRLSSERTRYSRCMCPAAAAHAARPRLSGGAR